MRRRRRGRTGPRKRVIRVTRVIVRAKAQSPSKWFAAMTRFVGSLAAFVIGDAFASCSWSLCDGGAAFSDPVERRRGS